MGRLVQELRPFVGDWVGLVPVPLPAGERPVNDDEDSVPAFVLICLLLVVAFLFMPFALLASASDWRKK